MQVVYTAPESALCAGSYDFPITMALTKAIGPAEECSPSDNTRRELVAPITEQNLLKNTRRIPNGAGYLLGTCWGPLWTKV